MLASTKSSDVIAPSTTASWLHVDPSDVPHKRVHSSTLVRHGGAG
ncbi:MAG TPA: hypothetical protein VNB51_10880 [Candidatus Udaeobacter sp.]|nr:hypothetical protein [Candidatus Udaeobacter sp.]